MPVCSGTLEKHMLAAGISVQTELLLLRLLPSSKAGTPRRKHTVSIVSQAERSTCVEAGIQNGFLRVPDSTTPSPLSYHVLSAGQHRAKSCHLPLSLS